MYACDIHALISKYTAAFTYYYDPEILQNKLTPLSIFRDLALRKRDSKIMFTSMCSIGCILTFKIVWIGSLFFYGFSGR